MTRINASIPVYELCNKHLQAEAFELMRIPNAIDKGKANLSHIPTVFKLGSGHVKFFYDKLQYLSSRYSNIVAELKYRGFNPTDYSDTFVRLRGTQPQLFTTPYLDNPIDKAILVERLNERFQTMKSVAWTKRDEPSWSTHFNTI